MQLAFRITNNVIAAVVSIIFLVYVADHLDKIDKKNRIYLLLFIINTAEIIIETITCIIDGISLGWLIPISKLLNMISFVLGPVISYLWFLFVMEWIKENRSAKHRSVKKAIMLLPLILNTAVSILTLKFDFIFKITPENVYVRQPMIFIPAVCTYFYMICSLIYIYKNRKVILSTEFIPLIMALIFGSIGGIIQLSVYGLLVIWSIAAYSFIIIYILFQHEMSQMDMLTGTWMRSRLKAYLDNRMKKNNLRAFSIVFIDLDEFKNINDVYGHKEGDRALVTIVKLIRSSIHRGDFITRFGGDEFILFLNVGDKKTVEEVIKRIYDSLERYNLSSNKPYNLSFSYGYEIYDFNNPVTPDEYISHVDKLMYKNKKHKKFIDSSIKKGGTG
ncbi:GGDEF domain-containing protein [Clostridium sp. LBM24168]